MAKGHTEIIGRVWGEGAWVARDLTFQTVVLERRAEIDEALRAKLLPRW